MLKVGLLGAGRIAGVHAAAIAAHPGSSLVAVSDINVPAAEKLASLHGAEVLSTDAVIDDPTIDAILIATSTDTHSDLIERAVAAGKAVLCEKPVDLSLLRARACQAKVNASGKAVMIGFNRRFDRNFAALKVAIERGEIGKIELLSITSFDPAPPPVSYVKVSGGIFRDMMIHDFDMACFLTGEAPVSIMAVGSSIIDRGIGEAGDLDTAVVTMTYGDGRIAVIKNSRRAIYGYDQRVEVLGSEGLLQANNVLENTVVKSTKAGVTSAKPTYFFLERYTGAYSAEWDAFVEGASGEKAFPVDLNDGVTALAIAEAATLSANIGKPVRMDEV